MYKDIHLNGKYCSLVPLALEHTDELIQVVKDGELWRLWFTFIPAPNEMKSDILKRLQWKEQGTMIPFTVYCNQTLKPVGMTSFLNIDVKNKRMEIGGTWYRAAAQKTAINTESKLMLLTYAFETLKSNAVEFRTHAINHSSRKSIERLGAKLDGVLRNHMIMPNGTLRDTCVYSIVAGEWLTVKSNLEYLLDR